MRILLDTHVLLLGVGRARRLDVATSDALGEPANDVLFSAVSIGRSRSNPVSGVRIFPWRQRIF